MPTTKLTHLLNSSLSSEGEFMNIVNTFINHFIIIDKHKQYKHILSIE